MSTSGARSGRWWAINAAILLVFSYVLSSCSTVASALSPTATPYIEPDIQIIQITIVDKAGNPIKNAVVHVSQPPQVDDYDHKGYWVQSCIDGQTISVWAPEYEIASVDCSTTNLKYTIILHLLTKNDSVTSTWLSANVNCAGCHNSQLDASLNEFSEWKFSGHATTLTDGYLETMYKGTSLLGEQNISPGFRLDYPNEYGNCAYCHAPSTVEPLHLDVDLFKFLPALRDVQGEGVTCDICHKIIGLKLDDDGYPYSNKPGVLSFEFGPSQNDPNLMIGPYINTKTSSGSQASIACSPVFSQSEFCAACHYGKFYDEVIYDSYGEWLRSDFSKREITSSGKKEENKGFRSCQDCHMPSPRSILGKLPSERDACSVSNIDFNDFDHNVMHYDKDTTDPTRIPLLVKDAATLDVELATEEKPNTLRVIVKVASNNVGHRFPTDSPLRHLILVVEATDKNNNPLPQVDETRIPIWGGAGTNKPFGIEAYGGMPGKIFAKLLVDKDTNISPTSAYWKPTRLLAGDSGDNRLEPGKPDESDYFFAIPPEGEVTVKVKLVYRYAFFDLALQKYWDRPDIVVVSDCKTYPNPGETRDCE